MDENELKDTEAVEGLAPIESPVVSGTDETVLVEPSVVETDPVA